MSSEEKAYRYEIPLVTSNGVESPAYQTNGNGEVLYNAFGSSSYVEVTTQPAPHLHKDSVGVDVTEVDATNYGYNPDQTEDGGEE